MRKRFLIIALAMSTLIWISPGRPALAATFSCQATGFHFYVPENTLFHVTAAWTVSTLGKTTFSSGVQTTNYYEGCSCTWSLYTPTSSFSVANGSVNQTLVWVLVNDLCSGSCTYDSPYTDHVFLVSNKAGAGVFADDNVGDQGGGGTGVCVPQ